MFADDSADAVIGAVWKGLVDRYKELEDHRKALDAEPRVVVLGAAESRPDELFRALFGQPRGTARHVREDGQVWEAHATFALEDVPGVGLVGVAGDEERALSYLRETDANLFCLLRDRRPTDLELGLWDHVRRLRRAKAVVVNTPEAHPPAAQPLTGDADKAAWTRWQTELQRVLDDAAVKIVRVRRLRSGDLVELARYIHEQLASGLRLNYLALLKHESSRGAIISDIIHGFARTAAALGLNPIPYSDALAITPVQVILVCRIAAAHGQKIGVAASREFAEAALGTVAGGVAFRSLYKVVKRRLGEPSLGICMALGAAVAWLGTEIIGRAAHLYYAAGGARSLRHAARQAAAEVVDESLLGKLML